jgi:diaminopimelate decarboxylase
MSSTYNARPLAAQVLVAGHEWSVIRPRQTLSSLWEAETMPEFLKPEFLQT